MKRPWLSLPPAGKGWRTWNKHCPKYWTQKISPRGRGAVHPAPEGDAQAALDSLREGEQALALGLTLDAVTVCVEGALHALSALTGEQVSEEIVDRVFEEFCVGK